MPARRRTDAADSDTSIGRWRHWSRACCLAGACWLATVGAQGLVSCKPGEPVASPSAAPFTGGERTAPARGNDGAIDITFEDYFSELERVRDDVAKRERYARGLSGSRVCWEGYLDEVVSRSGSRLVAKFFVSRDRGDGRAGLAVFPRAAGARVAETGKDDLVRVCGRLELDSVYCPLIDEAESPVPGN